VKIANMTVNAREVNILIISGILIIKVEQCAGFKTLSGVSCLENNRSEDIE
jgi:hypothetical protein